MKLALALLSDNANSQIFLAFRLFLQFINELIPNLIMPWFFLHEFNKITLIIIMIEEAHYTREKRRQTCYH